MCGLGTALQLRHKMLICVCVRMEKNCHWFSLKYSRTLLEQVSPRALVPLTPFLPTQWSMVVHTQAYCTGPSLQEKHNLLDSLSPSTHQSTSGSSFQQDSWEFKLSSLAVSTSSPPIISWTHCSTVHTSPSLRIHPWQGKISYIICRVQGKVKMWGPLFKSLFVSQSYHNKSLHIVWLKTTQMDYLTVLEAGSPKSRCQQSGFLLKTFRIHSTCVS